MPVARPTIAPFHYPHASPFHFSPALSPASCAILERVVKTIRRHSFISALVCSFVGLPQRTQLSPGTGADLALSSLNHATNLAACPSKLFHASLSSSST